MTQNGLRALPEPLQRLVQGRRDARADRRDDDPRAPSSAALLHAGADTGAADPKVHTQLDQRRLSHGVRAAATTTTSTRTRGGLLCAVEQRADAIDMSHGDGRGRTQTPGPEQGRHVPTCGP